MEKLKTYGSNTKRCWSNLLTKEENKKLRRLVKTNCPNQTTLTAAVVQLFIPEPPVFINWTKAECGVICVTRDKAGDCFLKLFCLIRGRLIWEMKLSTRDSYQTPKLFFHTITGPNKAQFGINFADESEAYAVLSALRRNQLDKQRMTLKRKLSKSDIGIPKSFKIVRHISWDCERGFRLYNIDNDISAYLVNGSCDQLDSLPTHRVPRVHGSILIRKKKITKDDIGMPFNFRHITRIGRDERSSNTL